ncbi:hypothetical protein KO528_01355 [Saccharophagus degradans]|uniref:hypothetical protein n=1 Tax=Saccharophagus degradans TaxID=86304 RepID=UPI001C0A36A7|nr:hypothetical protein [Saccharophagus degradans]MBU2983984.1 hypothetical protein [Saccharophagus degradans]
MNKRLTYIFSLIFICSACYAEVSDKMPSNIENLLKAIIVGLFCGFLSWFRWWLGAIGVIVFILSVVGIVSLWQEVHMREALLHEQGWNYFGSLVIGSLFILVFTAAGAYMSLCRRKNA